MSSDSDSSARLLVAVGDDLSRQFQQPKRLEQWGGEIIPACDASTALSILRRRRAALVLVSAAAGRDETIRFIRDVREISGDVPLVVISDSSDADDAVRFIHAGASDHIAESLDDKTFVRLIEGLRFESDSSVEKRRRWFSQACPDGVEIAGQSPGMTKCLEMVRLVSDSRCNPVLILGETGAGKEMIARAVHWWRYGDFDNFVAVNCATLTANLMASELFGHVKGAFTGADRQKTGLFAEAENGSIFLDEISEMPPELQAQLLRVIQEKAFRKVGATRDTECNATILASSNKDLLAQVEAGGFRSDLYYRLAVLPIVISPIRREDRREDIALLAEYFLETSEVPKPDGTPKLSREARRVLTEYHWPGNVRELRNVIERALILQGGDEISAAGIVFDQHIEDAGSVSARNQAPGPEQDFSLEAAEREFIRRALDETGWQRTRAAALLGITRATLYAKLKRYDIKAPDAPETSDAPSAKDAESGDSSAPQGGDVSENRTMSA